MLHYGGLEKRTRTHDLAAIQEAFASPATLRRTMTAARDAAALGMDSEAVVRTIQDLRYPADFDKSATAHQDPRRWHDSYKPLVDGRRLYLQFTVDTTGAFLLTSFKEA